jgi:hypothetical protein
VVSRTAIVSARVSYAGGLYVSYGGGGIIDFSGIGGGIIVDTLPSVTALVTLKVISW